MADYSNVPMSLDDVAKVIKRYNLSGCTAQGIGLYLSGQVKTKAEAGRLLDVSPSLFTHALARMAVQSTCECCGQVVYRIEIGE